MKRGKAWKHMFLAGLALAVATGLVGALVAFAAPGEPSPHGRPQEPSICLACHEVHTSVNPLLLQFPNGDEACWSCHDPAKGLPFRRSDYERSPHFKISTDPDNHSSCLGCHNPHGRAVPGPKLLRTTSGEPNQLCATCHPAKVGGRSFTSLKTYHESRHADPKAGARRPGEATSGAGECSACHPPHGSEYPGLLRAETPQRACLACHPKANAPDGLWRGEKAYARSGHAALCLKCHNPHGVSDPRTGTAYPKMLTAGSPELCLSCHSKVAEQFAASREASAKSGVRSRHPADEAGAKVSCADCHNPHVVRANPPGGYEAALSDPAQPGKLYAWLGGNSSNEYCLRCHDGSWPGAANIKAEAADRTQTGSGFVWAGKGVSLHNLHLSRYHKQKCSNCHDPHASTGSTGIARGHLLRNLEVTSYADGYPGFDSCGTNCHHVRCASCHPAPPDWARPQ